MSDSEHGIPIRAMFSWRPFQGEFKVQQIILKGKLSNMMFDVKRKGL